MTENNLGMVRQTLSWQMSTTKWQQICWSLQKSSYAFRCWVCLPKGSTDAHGIGMLEVMWMVVEGLIDTLVKAAVQFHDVLYGFHAGSVDPV